MHEGGTGRGGDSRGVDDGEEHGGGGREHRIEVPRTARYLTLGPDDARDVWIVLHGYRQLAGRFLRRFGPIDDGSRLVVAPEALSRFYVERESGRHGPGSVVGATWMTREAREDEIRDYVRYLDLLAEHILAPGPTRRLTVLGFSQGVATASRWTTLGRVRPERLVLWGDFIPPDLDLDAARARWSSMRVLLVRGAGDRTLSSGELAAREARQWADLGVEPAVISYEGGHDIDVETLRRIAAEGAAAEGGGP